MSKTVQAHVLAQYNLLQQMGSGAYGHVWQVEQKKSKKHYALKKVFDAFRNSIDAQRTYRQVEILNQLNHQNIIKLFKVIKSKNKKDLYLIFEFMQADLHSVVGSNILQKMHQIYVFYQILKALKYLHSAQLIHRDLKPSNILLNSQCQVKICDFGLIRTLNSQNDQQAILSQEVATKWYRAPELLLGSRSYRKPIDVWSFGCIVAELLIGKPLFAGDSTLNQLQKIMQYNGDVLRQDIEALDSPVAEQLITQIKVKKKSFRQYFSSVDPDFWVLLKGSLQFNPNKRMTIDQILQLQIFDQFRNQIPNLKTCNKAIRPKIDDNTRFNMKVYRDKIYEDIDKKNKSNSVKQNHLNQLNKKSLQVKKMVASNEKSFSKSLDKSKKRVQSHGYPTIIKAKANSYDKAQKKVKKVSSNKSLKSISNDKLSPYHSELVARKRHSSPNFKSNVKYISKPSVYKSTQNSLKTQSKKLGQSKQKLQENKLVPNKTLLAYKSLNPNKILKKVTSVNGPKFNTKNLLKKIGFDH